MAERQNLVVVTGSNSYIGPALVDRFARSHRVVGLDLKRAKDLPVSATSEVADLSSDESVQHALEAIRKRHGGHIASVIHLATYFDLTGKPNPKYEQITVRGSERLIRALQAFDVDQFVFVSPMLAHRALRPRKPPRGRSDYYRCGMRNGGSGTTASVLEHLFGLWLVAAPWVFAGATAGAIWNDVHRWASHDRRKLPAWSTKYGALWCVGSAHRLTPANGKPPKRS